LIGSPRILICAAFKSALDVGQWVTGRRIVGSFQGLCRARTPSQPSSSSSGSLDLLALGVAP
jgi:hypothetical protein